MKAFFTIAVFLGVALSVNAQDTAVDSQTPASPCFQKVMGEVRDGVTKEILPNTIVSIQTDDGTPIATQMVQKDGKFQFSLDCNTKYRLKASKKKYTLESKNFATTDISGAELKTKIFLDKGSIAFVKDEKAINATKNKVAETLAVKTPELKSDLKAIESIEKTVSEEVEIEPKVATTVAEKNVNEDVEVKTDIVAKEQDESKIVASVEETIVEKDDEIKKDIVSKEQVETPKVATVATKKNIDNKDVLVLEPVLFDYESSYLNSRAKKELVKIVSIMKENPEMVLECASYTDAKGPENYNMWMSKRRAKRTVEYLVRRGVPASRISGKGYGETKLINNCEDDCSDEERQVNRRTEFIIVKN